MSPETIDQGLLFERRVLSWFSCGAASAVATKLACKKWRDKCTPVYCNTLKSEHQDNLRFLKDIEQWVGVQIKIIGSEKYTTIDDVFEKTAYMSGPNGARCTTELKKVPRLRFQYAEDIHVFGFTANEQDRITEFEALNPELTLDWVLRDAGVTKQQCYQILVDAKIKLPEMYLSGYPNNNCPGCVKASSPGYWNKIRRDFPEVFARRAAQSRKIGCRLVRYKRERIFLDELPENAKGRWKDEVISCGPDCGTNSR